jgi:hypothetical protein
MKKDASDKEKALANWNRYRYGRDRGHLDFIRRAKVCEGIYVGGGLQYSTEEREALETVPGRVAVEVNIVQPKVHAALGYQIGNRVDIAYRPRGQGADDNTARVLTKAIHYILDSNHYKWRETQMVADGLIESRGYLDVRIEFDSNMQGSISIAELDPRDVIPDPDSKTYDPEGWHDVIVTRWMTNEIIAMTYGDDKVKKLEAESTLSSESDWGEELADEGRNRFGTEGDNGVFDIQQADDSSGTKRWRVIDRQFYETVKKKVAVYPTGDIRVWDDMTDQQQAHAIQTGAGLVDRLVKQVRWLVTAGDSVTLFDDVSPYPFFTIVPYFPVFRRGITRGLVDAAVDPQKVFNKAISSYIHQVAATANSGWIVEENSLVNMTTDELEERGAEPGLVLVTRRGTQNKPDRIRVGDIPQGLERIIERAAKNVEDVTGINEAMTGQLQGDLSGLATQALQFAAQQQLSIPLDNLSRTRHILAKRLLCLVQKYYTEERVFRITEETSDGVKKEVEVTINQRMPDGHILNNLTIGEYDVIVSEQPMQITFQNSQFNQAIKMMEIGMPIPPAQVLRYSNLENKEEIIEQLNQQKEPEDPRTQAKADLMKVQAEETKTRIAQKKVETMFAATEAAQNIAALAQVAPLADALLLSAGFQDSNEAPIVPSPAGLGVPPVPQPDSGMRQNTSPLFPPRTSSPMTGIEGGQ